MENIAMIVNTTINYLTGSFDYATELRLFGMAFQACMAVRNGPNKDNKMVWFHAFMLSLFTAFSGSFAPLLMGRPTLMLSNDLIFVAITLAFILVNYTPFSVGYKIGGSFPGVLVYTLFAQLFRVSGLITYNSMAFEAFQNSSSKYYSVPIVGPILLPIALANLGAFFAKGFDGHLKNGMPWPVQNGIFCATFYHFYVNDQAGIIGATLREYINVICDFLKEQIIALVPELDAAITLSLSEQKFAVVVVSAFMHVTGILQLPYFFGPSFSPFVTIFSLPIMIYNGFTSFFPSNTSEKMNGHMSEKMNGHTRSKNTGNANKSAKRKKSKGGKEL